MSDFWASDVPISLPDTNDPNVPIQVDFGGFGFTTLGMTHNFNTADRDEILSHRFAPKGEIPRG